MESPVGRSNLVANGCVEAGHDSAIVLAGDAADLIVGDTAQSVQGVGIPPATELLAKLVEHKIPIYV